MNKSNILLVFAAFSMLLIASCSRPVAKFTYSPEDNTAPASVIFENESKKAKAYEWDFGDGTTSQEASPEHKYTSSGNYNVTLTAKAGDKTSRMEKKLVVDAPRNCLVELETDYGNMVIQLYDATPKHRDNFIKLVEEGFYDGLLFHRVINGFMIQGGDPDSKNAPSSKRLGSGGPGYQVPAEFVDSLIHVKGALAAARMGDQVNPEKKSSGSQFYIVQGSKLTEENLESIEIRKGFKYTPEQKKAYTELGGTPFLDRDYTVFGRVIEGLEVIDKIANVVTQPGDRPKEDVKMKMRVVK